MSKSSERADRRRGRPARAAQGRRGSKNYEPARAATGSYRPGAGVRPQGFKGTAGFDYKGKKGIKKFVAGANILDAQGKSTKRKGFSDYLKATGNRADDPRNWEFHYKAPSSRYSTRGKNDRQVDNVASAKGRAMRTARKTGQSVYDVQKIEYQTAGIIQSTERSGAVAKATGGGFGSTSVAANVAAQKQRGRRGRGGGRGSFNAPTQTRTSRVG